jgi:hypothetical protein
MGSVTSHTKVGYVNYITTTTWIRIDYRIYSLLIYNHTNYSYSEHFSTGSTELVRYALTGTEKLTNWQTNSQLNRHWMVSLN